MKSKNKSKKVNHHKFYFSLLFFCVVFTVIICFLAYYMIGVFERSSMNIILERRIDKVQMALDNNLSEQDAIIEIMSNETVSKAKSLSLMLIHNSFTDDGRYELIEETRIALNLSEFYITDENGYVISGTEAFIGNNISEIWPDTNFLRAVEDKSYVEIIKPSEQTNGFFTAAVSRIDADGVIVVCLDSVVLKTALDLTDISQVTSVYPIFKNGTTSIIDIESYKYLSHTNEEYIGQTLQIPVKRFKNLDEENGNGHFTIRFEGKKQYIYYEVYGDYLITANVPSSEMFARRNFTFGALLITCPLICFVILLASRKNLIDQGFWV